MGQSVFNGAVNKLFPKKEKFDRTSWLCFSLLIVLFLLSILISASLQFEVKYPYYNYFYRLLIYILAALVVFFAFYLLDYNKIIEYSWIALICGIALLLANAKWEGCLNRLVIGNCSYSVIQLEGVLCTIGITGTMQRIKGKPAVLKFTIIILLSLLAGGIYWLLYEIVWQMVILAVTIYASVNFFRYGTFKSKKWIYISLLVVVALLSCMFIYDNIYIEFGVKMASIIEPLKHMNHFGYVNYISRMIIKNSVLFGRCDASAFEISAPSISPGATIEGAMMYVFFRYGWVLGLISVLVLCTFEFLLCKLAIKAKHKRGGSLAVICCIPILIQTLTALFFTFGIYYSGIRADVLFLSMGGISILANMILVGTIFSISRSNITIQRRA